MSSAASSAETTPGPGPVGPLIALVAGEASGDLLGAALIRALRLRHPRARFVGIGGAQMAAEGMDCWRSADELAVMGLFEVLSHLPRLLQLRSWLVRRLMDDRPDILVGIDAPDFNLGVERRVRAAGIRTVHYVSPTVWAWRQRRVRKIAASADRVLCLFPFEPAFYVEHGVAADYTGHPMADQVPDRMEPVAARRDLGLPESGRVVALLPGSRVGEVSRLAEPLLGAAAILAQRYPGLQFVAAMANRSARETFERALQGHPGLSLTMVDGQARLAMAAADVVACASGTAALETLLVKRPMVVVYRLSALTYLVAKWLRLVKSRFFSLPNILAGESLVPELLQGQANPARIADEVARWLDDPAHAQRLQARFAGMHADLRRDAANSAAGRISDLLGHSGPGQAGVSR